MFGADFESERVTSIDDYKLTCIQFIEDISNDYKDWADRYKLPSEENMFRKNAIDNVVRTTNEWIGKYGNTIKKIDIIKDDGINKMAELTAGYPFEFNVYLGEQYRYVHVSAGQLKLNVKAKPRQDKKVKIAYYAQGQFVQLLSSCNATVNESIVDFEPKDLLDSYVVLDASNCKSSDIISITLIVEEVGEFGGERRGLSTLIRIK